jgi:hypothetical protein
MEPVTTTLALKAALTAAAKSAVVQKFADGLRSVLGDTPTDRERKASARDMLARALDGDNLALGWLFARSGIRPNAEIVKVAPRTAQHIFRTALRTYYTATRTMPPEDAVRKLWPSGVPSDLLATTAPMPVRGGGLGPTTGYMIPGVAQAGFGGSGVLPLVLGLGLVLALARQGSAR